MVVASSMCYNNIIDGEKRFAKGTLKPQEVERGERKPHILLLPFAEEER